MKKNMLTKSGAILAAVAILGSSVGGPMLTSFANNPEGETPSTEEVQANIANVIEEEAINVPEVTEVPEPEIVESAPETPQEIPPVEEIEIPETETVEPEVIEPVEEVVTEDAPVESTLETQAANVGPQNVETQDEVKMGTITFNYYKNDNTLMHSETREGEVGELLNYIAPGEYNGLMFNVTRMDPRMVWGMDGDFYFLEMVEETPQTVNFYYQGESATASVRIVDEVTGNTLFTINTISGEKGMLPHENVRYDTLVNEWKEKGYEVTSNTTYPKDSPFVVAGHNDWVISLTHGFTSTYDESTTTHTIYFVSEDAVDVADAVTQTHTFKKEDKTNKVTNEYIPGDWSKVPAYTFDSVSVPQVKGYTPDKTSVSNVRVTHNDDEKTSYVVYKAKDVPLKVTFKDDQGNVVDTATQTSKFGRMTNFGFVNSKLNSLKAKGWNVTANGAPTSDLFVEEESYSYEVTLTPRIDKKTEHASSTRTIKFKTEDGREIRLPEVQKVNFSREKSTNAVTGTSTYTEWVAKGSDEFAGLSVEDIRGYTPTQDEVASSKAVRGQNQVETVTFIADEAEQKVVFVDKNNDNEELFADFYTGKFGDTIQFDEDTVNEFLTRGYKVVTNGVPTDAKFGDNNIITITLEHDTEETKETKEVTRTVKFVQDDKEIDSKVQTVTFTRTKTTDKVTEDVTYSDWVSENDTFAKIDVPEIDGFIADKKVVDSEKATVNSVDKTVTVSYSVIEQSPVEEETPTEDTTDVDETPSKDDEIANNDNTSTNVDSPKEDASVDLGDNATHKETSTNEKAKKSEDIDNKTNKSSDKKENDPQTSIVKSNNGLIAASLSAVAGALGLVGFIANKKRKENN